MLSKVIEQAAQLKARKSEGGKARAGKRATGGPKKK